MHGIVTSLYEKPLKTASGLLSEVKKERQKKGGGASISMCLKLQIIFEGLPCVPGK